MPTEQDPFGAQPLQHWLDQHVTGEPNAAVVGAPAPQTAPKAPLPKRTEVPLGPVPTPEPEPAKEPWQPGPSYDDAMRAHLKQEKAQRGRMVTLRCPGCGHRGKVPYSAVFRNKKLQCTECGRPFEARAGRL